MQRGKKITQADTDLPSTTQQLSTTKSLPLWSHWRNLTGRECDCALLFLSLGSQESHCCQPRGDTPPQHLTGTTKEPLFLFLLAWLDDGDRTSQLLSRQVQATEIWHWRDVTLGLDKPPLRACAKKRSLSQCDLWCLTYCSSRRARLPIRPRLQQRGVAVAMPQKAI